MTALIREFCANCGNPTGNVVDQDEHNIAYCDFCQGAAAEAQPRGCPNCGSRYFRARQRTTYNWDVVINRTNDRGIHIITLNPDYQDRETIEVYCVDCERSLNGRYIVGGINRDFEEE